MQRILTHILLVMLVTSASVSSVPIPTRTIRPLEILEIVSPSTVNDKLAFDMCSSESTYRLRKLR